MDSTSASAVGRPASAELGSAELGRARRWDQIAAVAGLVVTALTVAGIFTPSTPDVHDSGDAIARAITADLGRHQTSLLLGFLSDVAFLIFLAGVWARLRRAEGRGGLFGGLFAMAAAALTAVILVSEGIYLGVVMGATTAADQPGVVKTLALLNETVGAGVLAAGAAMFLAAAAGILGTLAFPRWLSWLAALTALCLLVALAVVFEEDLEGSFAGIVALVGFLLVVVWTLAASVVLLLRAGRSTATHEAEVHA